MEADRRKSGRARPPVSKAEPPALTWMGEDRSACKDVLDELVAGLHNGSFLLSPFRPDVSPQEFPAVDSQLPNMLQYLGCLQAETLGDDQTRPPANPVGLHSGEVPVAADLLFLRPLPVDPDRAVAHDQLDFLPGGCVLQMLELLVDRYLLLEPLYLLLGGAIGPDPKFTTDDVCYQDAQRLSGASRRADGSRVVDIQVGAAILVLLHLHARQPLKGGHHDPFREQGQAGSHRPFDALLQAPRRPEGHFLGYHQGRLFAVVVFAQFSDSLGHAIEPVLLQEPLDPTGEVLRPWNLDIEFRIQPPRSSLRGHIVAPLSLGVQALEVVAYLLAAIEVPHPTTQESERQWGMAYKGSPNSTVRGPVDVRV